MDRGGRASASPSPPFEGGEGWGEEGRLAYKQRSSPHRGAPLPVRPLIDPAVPSVAQAIPTGAEKAPADLLCQYSSRRDADDRRSAKGKTQDCPDNPDHTRAFL